MKRFFLFLNLLLLSAAAQSVAVKFDSIPKGKFIGCIAESRYVLKSLPTQPLVFVIRYGDLAGSPNYNSSFFRYVPQPDPNKSGKYIFGSSPERIIWFKSKVVPGIASLKKFALFLSTELPKQIEPAKLNQLQDPKFELVAPLSVLSGLGETFSNENPTQKVQAKLLVFSGQVREISTKKTFDFSDVYVASVETVNGVKKISLIDGGGQAGCSYNVIQTTGSPVK